MIDPGLCGRCANARIVVSGRGSRFWLCALSRVDARFPRYPPLPVTRCGGFIPGEPSARGPEETTEREE